MTIPELIELYSGPDTSEDVLKEFGSKLLRTIEPTRMQCVGIGEHEALSKNFWSALEQLEAKA